jgi:two-component system cell cycle sensor histidine kinase/response regulator CckA
VTVGRLWPTRELSSPAQIQSGGKGRSSRSAITRDKKPPAPRIGDDLAWQELRKSERRFRELARHAPVGIFLTDAKGGCLFVNERWCQIAGITAQEAWGQGWEKVIHPDDRARILREWTAATAAGREMVAECRFQSPAGRPTWVQCNANPLHGENGETEGYVGMVLDMNAQRSAEDERRQHEAQLQHVQKLESLGVLAGGIAHDFNNLLTSVLGYSNLALMQLPIGSPACPLLREIEQAARRAAELTQQMLAYSGKGKFVVQKLGLHTLVQEMAKLLETVVSKKALLRIDLEPATIEGDATQIRQIVMNLIANASDALEGQIGVIHLRTGQKRVDSAFLRSPYSNQELPAGIYAFLEVEDDGCGMDAETLAKIFDPFFTTKFTGRGLGLAAVLGIVRGHNGSIKMTSTPRQGTCFQVFFPSVPAITDPAAAGAPLPQQRGQGTVLIVEDEFGVRNLSRRVLEGAGFDVLEAADGLEGLEQLRRHRQKIALVLLDLMMPRLDGAEMLQELRRRDPQLPVLVMSGYSEEDVTARCAGLAVSGFVQKPFEARDLVGRVCGLLPCTEGDGL